MSEKKITMNKAKCRNCGDTIESLHVHHFVSCSCLTNEEDNTGIFVDGGLQYYRWGGNFDNFIRIEEDV